jgi:poly(A) polymerase
LINPEALSILVKTGQFLKERQVKTYLAGGFVRDTLLGRSTADIDIVVAGDALKLAAEMAEALDGRFVMLDDRNRIARVVLNELPSGKLWYIDVSTLAGDIDKDLARRDFTIDAMAVDIDSFLENPGSPDIIDPFRGQADLQTGTIRAVSNEIFEADPVRLLRAVRLSAELGFRIAVETETSILHSHPLVARVAGERVREELLRILAVPKAGRFVRYLDNAGLLTAIIPELEPSRGMEQPKEHHWDVLNHALETVRAVEFLLRQGEWEYATDVLQDVPWSEKLYQHFNTEVGSSSTRSSLLKLAALLHDIAKPETKIIANERMRFFGHTEQGAEVVAGILERLRFSNKEIKLVELLVRYHLRPTQMSHAGMPTARAIYRYFRDTGTAGVDILFLSLADHLAARGPSLDREQWKWHVGQVNYILTECLQKKSVIAPPKLIDGHDLISQFGLKPGPQIREILEAVKEAQAAGELSTREQALYYVKNRLLYRE